MNGIHPAVPDAARLLAAVYAATAAEWAAPPVVSVRPVAGRGGWRLVSALTHPRTGVTVAAETFLGHVGTNDAHRASDVLTERITRDRKITDDRLYLALAYRGRRYGD